MPVSDHPIAVTFIAPTWSTTLNGFDVGELSDRAIAYLMPRLPAPHTLKVKITTQQPMAEEQIRKAIEDAVLKNRANHPSLTSPAPREGSVMADVSNATETANGRIQTS